MRGRLIASISLGLFIFLALGVAGPALATGGSGEADPEDPANEFPGPDHQPPDCSGDEGDPDDFWEIGAFDPPTVQLEDWFRRLVWGTVFIVFPAR